MREPTDDEDDSSPLLSGALGPTPPPPWSLCEATPPPKVEAYPAETIAAPRRAASVVRGLVGVECRRAIPSPAHLSSVRLLGSGGYGQVTLVRDEPSKRLYALKRTRKAHVLAKNGVRRCAWMWREKALLEAIDHPFVVRLHGTYADEHSVALLLSVALGGDLFGRMGTITRMTEEDARFYAASLALVLHHLHLAHGILYRDLKLENVLIDAQGYVTLCDFGLAKALGPSGRSNTRCGTDDYMAPEMLRSQSVGLACDWWALGVLLYEILDGAPPFTDPDSTMNTYSNILAARYARPASSESATVPAACSALVSSLCTVDEKARLGSAEGGEDAVLEHSWWLQDGLQWEALVNRAIDPPWRPRLAHATDTSHFDDAEPEPVRRSVEGAAADGVSAADKDDEREACWRELQRFYGGGAVHEIGHLSEHL